MWITRWCHLSRPSRFHHSISTIIFLFTLGLSLGLFVDFWKISQIFPFPACFLPVLEHFPSDSRKFIIPPLFPKFSPLFSKHSTAFYILYVYFPPPYFDHDAFMHHPMHVLDAPGGWFVSHWALNSRPNSEYYWHKQ